MADSARHRGWKWDGPNGYLEIWVDGTRVGYFDDANYDLTLDTNGINLPTGKLSINSTAVTSTAAELNKLDGVDPQIIYLTAQIADISSAGSTFVVLPACTVTNIWTVIDGAITTGDAAITFENNAGTALTGGSITIANSGSAAGDIDTCATTANNVFTEGQKLEIITDGGSTNAVLARVTIKATRSS